MAGSTPRDDAPTATVLGAAAPTPAVNAPSVPGVEAVSLTDRQIIARARRAKNGAAFTALWKGDTFGFASPEAADLAFCTMLAFWCGRDAARMDRVFRQSGLVREKWDQVYARALIHSSGSSFTSDRTAFSLGDTTYTYGQTTIGRALVESTDTYAGTQPKVRAAARDTSPRLPSASPGVPPATLAAQTASGPAAPAAEAELFPRTEIGDAELFVSLYSDRVRFDHNRERWLIFEDHVWRPDPIEQLRGLAIETVRERQRQANQIADPDKRKDAWLWGFHGESTMRINHLLREARAMPPIADHGAWDGDPWLLGCPNGVIDLRTGTLRPGRPEDRITRQTGIDYDPNAQSALFERVLQEVSCGDADLVAFLQRAFGYSLTGDTREDAWFFCHGGGRNGKGTLFSAVRGAMGEYAHELPASALDFAQRDKVPIDLAQLPGARFVTSAEIGNTIRLHHDRIKQITGGDPVRARGHYEAFFEFRPSCKLWLAANDKPRVTDDSAAFWARVHLIPFLASFMGREDKTIRLELEHEPAHRRAVLAWLVCGALAWQQEGLDPPAIVTRATTAYRHEQQVLAPFYAACCLVQPEAQVQASVLFHGYDGWCGATGVPPSRRLSQTAFGLEVKKRFPDKHIRGCVWYLGIGLREPAAVQGLDGR